MTFDEFKNETIIKLGNIDYILQKNHNVKAHPAHGLIYQALFYYLDRKVTISIGDILDIVKYEQNVKEALGLFHQVICYWQAYKIKGGAKKFEDDLKYLISIIKR